MHGVNSTNTSPAPTHPNCIYFQGYVDAALQRGARIQRSSVTRSNLRRQPSDKEARLGLAESLIEGVISADSGRKSSPTPRYGRICSNERIDHSVTRQS